MRTISLLNMTFVMIGSCESLRRGEIKIATQEHSSSMTKEACLHTEHRILARKRMDDLRINRALPQKQRRVTTENHSRHSPRVIPYFTEPGALATDGVTQVEFGIPSLPLHVLYSLLT